MHEDASRYGKTMGHRRDWVLASSGALRYPKVG